MSSDQVTAALFQRIERLEALVTQQAAQIVELETELKEWRSGIRVRGKQRKRRRVRGARDAKDAQKKGEDVGKRGAGRKDGHKGAGRKKPDTPDVVEHRVLEQCPGCNGALSDCGVAWRHTTEDIVLTVKTTEYHLHRHHCANCGEEHVAELPASFGGPVRIGPKALALAAWLRFDLGESFGKISRLFTEGIGLKWSAGSISQRLARWTVDMAPVVDQLWTDLLDEPCVYVDETGWREDGWRAWLWSASGAQSACFFVSGHRDRDSFEVMVPPDYAGIRMTDGYTAYNGIDADKHAGCWAHILRKARDAFEVHEHPEDGEVFQRITEFMRGARWFQAQWRISDVRPMEHHDVLFRQYCAILRSCEVAKTPRLRVMGRWLMRELPRYLLFLENRDVPLTNNQAERELRPRVIMRKTSFGSRNARGSQTLADGWTLIASLRRCGGNLFEFMGRAYDDLKRGIVPPLVPQPA
ncbi:MAG: IS66 family transposase [Myxococcota bacterium]